MQTDKQIYGPWGAAIAQWICMSLPSCHPGFESLAHHLCFISYSLICALFLMWKEQKEAGFCPIKNIAFDPETKLRLLIQNV